MEQAMMPQSSQQAVAFADGNGVAAVLTID
jgi:hypothetical protein